MIFEATGFLVLTIGMIVYFSGVFLTRNIAFLRVYNIPEPVTGGILAALVLLVLYVSAGFEVRFDLEIRDILLVYFFTAIGLNARLKDLLAGGRPLLLLLVLTFIYILLQNLVGMGMAQVMGQPAVVGILAGSASLIGGHGTAIAWAPEFVARHGIDNALETGVASATLGLVIASLLGGPIGKFLLARHQLSGNPDETHVVGLDESGEAGSGAGEQINHQSLMAVLLSLHVAIIIGYFLSLAIAASGLKLPLFVSCLFAAIFLSAIQPKAFPFLKWPARTRALAVVSDISLGLFIAMSLMGMQLWALADLAGPLLGILVAQTLAAAMFTLFVIFPVMGRNYLAAVLSAGFAGFSLGATPTAIANMTAITKKHGAAPTAFLILPLVGAFFVDLTNALVIQFLLEF